MKEILEIEGTVADIVYHNKENGYLVAVLESEEEEITVVGYLPVCGEGRSYRLKGSYSTHPRYGDQFAFTECVEIMPTSEVGIEGFLASGALKGIGPKMAHAVVAKFGEKTLEIIEKEPARLLEVPGIGEKKAASISEAYAAHREFAEVSIHLQQFGISSRYAMKLYSIYGSGTIEAVKTDPYRLAMDIAGIGFRTADSIAEKMGCPKEDENRVRSGILYTLSYSVGEGNTFVPQDELIEKACSILDVSGELVKDRMTDLAFDGKIKIDDLCGRRVVYPMAYFLAEQYVTAKLSDLNTRPLKQVSGEPDSVIDMAQKDTGLVFSDEQRSAIKACIDNGVCVITGGPGTGKTTIINGILSIFEDSGISTAIAAPTGRAAKRITETTGRPASTIHRLLEYYYSEDENDAVFGKNEKAPLDYDAIIVDEASMIDLMLMHGLLKAINTGSRLVIVGDADQLPSVGAGNVLRDILDCELIYSVRLRDIYRQAAESLIVVNAHRIRNGEYPDFNEKDKDFFLLRRSHENDMVAAILELCAKRLPGHYELEDPVRDIQVITPTRKGTLGTGELNKALQRELNPPAPGLNEKTYGSRTFREGDKVMQMKNNYLLEWKDSEDDSSGAGVFNGDVGYIHSIDEDSGIMTVVFDDTRFVRYDFSLLDELELAYAVTVHKAQGSEFPIVVMPVSWFPPVLATRNLIYTTVTRAKETVVLVGSEQRMFDMVDNDYIARRDSGLAERLRSMLAAEREMI